LDLKNEYRQDKKHQSRELLINGFLLDVIEKITDSEIKNLIKNMIGLKE